jgi:glucose/arabinose dehydrogenase
MAFLPDGRLLILEQGGKIRVLKNGQLLPTPFISVKTNDAVVSNGEEGLLGLAIDPNFSQNGYVYVYYTIMRT